MEVWAAEEGVGVKNPTLYNPMDCSLAGSSIHVIFQARVLEWVAISFSRVSFRPRDRTQVSLIVSQRLYRLSNQGSPSGLLTYINRSLNLLPYKMKDR